ncbi:choline O-acetyltransferase-like [Anneissia japonica]|uniref:choline O-acetyltransferase-like n=1 Tax=Anneissia japonica TaxID=1529436 RepID=UPI0014258E31|nr:choline O-acetyltransferase-like [Anneissia japonica]
MNSLWSLSLYNTQGTFESIQQLYASLLSVDKAFSREGPREEGEQLEGAREDSERHMSTERARERYLNNAYVVEDDEISNPICLKQLPPLPVPPLIESLELYLRSTKPLLTEEQYKTTEEIVTKFGEMGGSGQKLQTKLCEYAKCKSNWAYNWWLDDMYLRARLPLVVNSNPGMVFPKQQFEDRNQQLKFAARLISGILDYKVIIDARALPVDRARHNKPGQPLCMEQYYRLFSSYRVPGIVKDELVAPSVSVMPEPEHIIVVCRNQFFVLDVIINFKRLSEQDLSSQLKRIVHIATSSSTTPPIGLVTGDGRTEWAHARMRLMEDSTNRDSLDMIERCIFVLCLDENMDHPPTDINKPMDKEDVPLAKQMLHGGGSELNSGNRWFDKTMQFIVGEDGSCGLNYEHSPSEGVAVVQLVEHLLRYIDSDTHRRRLIRAQSICELPYPRKLRWKLSSDTLIDIDNARIKTDRLVHNVDLKLLRFTEFGKGFPKSQNMSPDAFVQLALQVTYYSMYGHLISTYESASTRRFHEGRVDNIRAASQEALEFARAIKGDRLATLEEKMKLMRKAIKAQTDFCIRTIMGQGFDCHLLGLRELSRELGEPVPEIFQDVAYEISSYFTLSTSQVLTKLDTFMCYGPVVPNGYGASYNPHEDYILFAISSFKDCPETDSTIFRESLYNSLMDMHNLCIKMNRKLRRQSAEEVNNDVTTENGEVINGDENTVLRDGGNAVENGDVVVNGNNTNGL